MIHVGNTANHTFLNLEDMLPEWNTIILPGHPFDMKARLLADNTTQISTTGLSAAVLFDDTTSHTNHPVQPRQSRIHKEQELVLTYNWPTGWGSASLFGLSIAAYEAASSAANAPQGSHSFCSTVL